MLPLLQLLLPLHPLFTPLSCVCLLKAQQPAPDEKKRKTETQRSRRSLLSSWQPAVPHIKRRSEIIWLAPPGLRKEAHTLPSEKRQQEERSTRGEPVKEGGRVFICQQGQGARESDRRRESTGRGGGGGGGGGGRGGGAVRDANCLLGATPGTNEEDSGGSSGRGKDTKLQC